MPLINLNFDDLVKLHGKPRLDEYLSLVPSLSKKDALLHYKENVATSLDFWEKIQFIEVALRNKIVEEWKISVGGNSTINLDWSTLGIPTNNSKNNKNNIRIKMFRYYFPSTNTTKNLYKIIQKVAKTNAKANSMDILISRLDINFWVKFLDYMLNEFNGSAKFFQGYKSGSNGIYFSVKQKSNYSYLFYEDIEKILMLRNAIAHHENIIKPKGRLFDSKHKNYQTYINHTEFENILNDMCNFIKKNWI